MLNNAVRNLAFSRNAIALATRAPALPPQGDSAADRLGRFLANNTQQGIFYYALQRSALVGTWLDYIATRPYTPSYLDQLLAAWCASHGNRLVVNEASMQLRDESGWVGFAACVYSDARFYPLPAMTLFHELFWSADLCRLLRHHPQFESLLPLLRGDKTAARGIPLVNHSAEGRFASVRPADAPAGRVHPQGRARGNQAQAVAVEPHWADR